MFKPTYHVHEQHEGWGTERRSLGFAVIQYNWFLDRNEGWDAHEHRVSDCFPTKEAAEAYMELHYGS